MSCKTLFLQVPFPFVPHIPQMTSTTKTSVLSIIVLPLALTAAILLISELSHYYALELAEHLAIRNIDPRWWHYPLFLILGVLVGLLSNCFPIKKTLPSALAFVGLWFALSFVALNYFETNLYFLRVAFITLATLIAVHLKKLWTIDQELTENLVNLATTGSLIEVKSAETRIDIGLQLLETVLPLSEAIVFRVDRNQNFRPIGRSRNGTAQPKMQARQAAWRETVAFCERAFRDRQTIVHTDNNESKSARVALPLVYEGAAVGVLFVRVHQNFERADQHLLESFCDQLARNFKRQELRSKNLPNKFWWSFLSTNSAEIRVGTTSLIRSLIKEQSFSAVASSYLKEAHAIAYLDGTLAYVNRQMRHLVDLQSKQISDLDLFGLLKNFRTDAFSEPHLAIRRVLQTGEVYRNELVFQEKKTLDLQISLVKVPSDNASIHDTNVALKPACFLITLIDITAVKENEKLRSDMASLMSHELRTPVTSIKGFAELLLMDDSITTENREFLQIIANESQRLSKMLSTFLSVSNLEQGDKKDVNKSAVRLDSVVGEVVDEFKENAKRKRIQLVAKNAPNLPPIAADKGLIRRAVSNLIDNAIRYSPERTQVLISTILEADFLRVVVEDRGYGIERSEHEKIWEKFYRVARDGQDKQEESTGLGLSLVKEIVEQHGGNVTVESQIGQGSRFSIALPRL
ncbi:MAG: GAF domain-containing protein [Acidobacteria bacterium]|nr:GAF domain-containing protein [Acidobacteriota bacterium]